MNPDELLRHLESLLFVAAEPAEIAQLANALEVSADDVESALNELGERGKWRGIRIQRRGQRVQFASAPESAPYVERFLGLTATTRLSQAALETLAIIAYRQPITRAEIEVLRGVDCDGVLRTLTARQLIIEVGRLDTVGHPIRYGTTFEFLRYFGLERLEQMPSLQPPAETSGTPTNGAAASDSIPQQETLTNESTSHEVVETAPAASRGQSDLIADSGEPAEPGSTATTQETEEPAGHLASDKEGESDAAPAVALDTTHAGTAAGSTGENTAPGTPAHEPAAALESESAATTGNAAPELFRATGDTEESGTSESEAIAESVQDEPIIGSVESPIVAEIESAPGQPASDAPTRS